jgi:hypothetical protein
VIPSASFPAPPMSLLATLERARLRLHFRRVLAELHAAPLPSGARAEVRARTVDALRGYAAAARFPRHGGRGRARPVFVDAFGTRCAMAHLLEHGGAAPLVARVAAERNHAYLPELARDGDVADAVRALGITPGEAARIQPCYYPSALQCLLAFALQWAAVGSAGWLLLGLYRPSRLRGMPWLVTRITVAVCVVLLGLASFSATRTELASGKNGMFCGTGKDWSVCGSAFLPGDVARQLREAFGGEGGSGQPSGPGPAPGG